VLSRNHLLPPIYQPVTGLQALLSTAAAYGALFLLALAAREWLRFRENF
jgi:hypothetical protein